MTQLGVKGKRRAFCKFYTNIWAKIAEYAMEHDLLAIHAPLYHHRIKEANKKILAPQLPGNFTITHCSYLKTFPWENIQVAIILKNIHAKKFSLSNPRKFSTLKLTCYTIFPIV